jgi:hypothetical protein
MKRRILLIALLLIATPLFSAKITLNKKWIGQHMNEVTTSISMDVMDVKDRPNTPLADGDIHMGGKSLNAGLPLVAEIMNAGLPPEVKELKFAQSHSGKTIQMTGIWRLWFEHSPAGAAGQIQKINGPIKMTRPAHVSGWTNPDHLFEVHPILSFGEKKADEMDFPESVHFVNGIKQYDLKTVFSYYEKKTVKIAESGGADGTISLDSTKSQYNYVKFVVRLQGKAVQTKSKDGYRLFGEIDDLKGNPIKLECDDEDACVRRMVVANDTEPFRFLKLSPGKSMDGSCFLALGIPRINLERINFILQNPDDFKGHPIHLPYEMILVGAQTTTACKGK